MHTSIFYLVAIWTAVLFGMCVILILHVPSAITRILVLDMLSLILIVLLVLYAGHTRSAAYLDAALMLALLAFTGTVVAAQFYSAKGKIFL